MSEQNFHIFLTSDASEQNHFTLWGEFFRETTGIALERFAIARISQINISFSKFAQIIDVDQCSRIEQSAAGRDHEHAGHAVHRPREGIRVSNFSPKVESAEKSKDFSDRRSLVAAQPPGEIELGPITHDHARPFASGEC